MNTQQLQALFASTASPVSQAASAPTADPTAAFAIIAQAFLQQVEVLNDRLAGLSAKQDELQKLISNQTVEKEWYTTTEVADIMGVKQYTVQERWCNQGRIECEKDPSSGKWRIPGTEVARLRAGNF